MLRFESGNLVTGQYPIFCQQVNCKGVMGSGLAKQIRDQYPEVYTEYKRACINGDARLGRVQSIQTYDGRICLNFFAQYSYGTDGVYTNYEAFKRCLNILKSKLLSPQNYNYMHYPAKKSIAFPMYIGCGLGGGKWNIILKMINDFAEEIPYDVIIVHKEKTK